MIVGVQGDFDCEDGGLVLPCEHVLFKTLVCSNTLPPLGQTGAPAVQFDALRDRHAVACSSPFTNPANARLCSKDTMFRELQSLAAASAQPKIPLILELTPPSFGRDAAGLRELAERSGVHIVMATGPPAHSASDAPLDGDGDALVRSWSTRMERDLEFGVGDSDDPIVASAHSISSASARKSARIRAGVIAVAVGDGDHAGEAFGLRAAARAAKTTGAPVFVHMPRVAAQQATLVANAPDTCMHIAVGSVRNVPATAVPTLMRHANESLVTLLAEGVDLRRVVLCIGTGTLFRQDALGVAYAQSSSALQVAPVSAATSAPAAVAATSACAAPWLAIMRRGASLCFCSGTDAGSSLLAHGGAEPLASAEDVLDLLFGLLRADPVCANRLLVSPGVCMKLQLQCGGGAGYASMVHLAKRISMSDVGTDAARQVLGANALKLVRWWTPPAAVEVPAHFIRCTICDSPFEPIEGEYFSKFSFVYCGTKCLRKHRKAGFKPRVQNT